MNISSAYRNAILYCSGNINPHTPLYTEVDYRYMVKVDIDCSKEFFIPNYNFTRIHTNLMQGFVTEPYKTDYTFMFPFVKREMNYYSTVKGGDSALKQLLRSSMFRFLKCGDTIFFGNSSLLFKRCRDTWELLMIRGTKCRRKLEDDEWFINQENTVMMVNPKAFLMDNPVERSLIKKAVYIFSDCSRFAYHNSSEVLVTRDIENYLYTSEEEILNPKELWHRFDERPIPF